MTIDSSKNAKRRSANIHLEGQTENGVHHSVPDNVNDSHVNFDGIPSILPSSQPEMPGPSQCSFKVSKVT